MKKILIIKTSPRKGGNSDRLADEFAGGVNEKGDIEGHPALAEAYRLGLGC